MTKIEILASEFATAIKTARSVFAANDVLNGQGSAFACAAGDAAAFDIKGAVAHLVRAIAYADSCGAFTAAGIARKAADAGRRMLAAGGFVCAYNPAIF